MEFYVHTDLIREREGAVSAPGDGLSIWTKVAIGVGVAVVAAGATVAAVVSYCA